MLELIGSALVPLLKWIFGMIAKKKLSDKEFVDYIRAHQLKRSKAGKAAMDWEDALSEAQKEMEAENKTNNE